MALHGKWFVLVEFGGAFVVLIIPAVFGLAKGHGHSLWLWYFLCLSLNYLPLFLYALLLAYRGKGQTQSETRTIDRTEAARYTKQQFWLLVPLVVLIAAIWQEVQRKRK